MKCNPLHWLWGLLPLTGLWWIGLLGMQQPIQDDLAQRSKAVLEQAGLPWAEAEFKGRDGLVGGRAEEESEQRRAAIEVAKVWGVRSLEDRTEVLELIKTYIWSATRREGAVALTGYVPNEAARKSILAAARSALPRLSVEDQMKLARGAPEQKLWLAATTFALRQLASLKNGGRASLEGTGFAIEGEAETSKSYETMRTALSGALPAGISLRSEKVVPPLVKPYVWGAGLRGRQIELTGHAPSLEARDQIKAAAARALPGGSVVDHISIGSGAPAEWQKVAAIALAKLGQLKQGTVEVRDNAFSIAGLTETEEAAQAIKRSLRPEIPAAFRITEDIRQDPAAKAAEEARIAAEEARRAAEEARRRAAEEAAKRAAEETARRAAAEAEARRVAELRRNETEEQARIRAAEEAASRRRAAEDAAKRAADEEAAKRAAAEAEARRRAEQQRAQAEERAKAQAAAEAASRARSAEAQRCQSALTAVAEAGTITFQRASADLDRRSHQTLNALAQVVRGCSNIVIEVEGHTDNEGEPDRNQRLSERRAQSVLDYLVKAGVPSASLHSAGYGETRPKVPNDSPANMARNRRIEFSVKSK